MPSVELPYSNRFGMGARPYLALTLTGPNGEPRTVIGLLDTGADTTALPVEDAAPMGYARETLTRMTILTADGPGPAFVADAPSSAVVPSAPSVAITLKPIFVPGGDVPLWGRTDVMRPFKVLFDEAGQAFTLRW